MGIELMVIWLPLGLMLLLGSAVPLAETSPMVVRLLLAWSVAGLAYFAVGFAFQFGGIAQVSPQPDLLGLYWEWYPLDPSVDPEVARLWGVIALQGWALTGPASTSGALHLFVSHVALVGVAAIIPAAALSRRLNTLATAALALIIGAAIYPIPGNWVWGGGWLANLGLSLQLGHGFVDFGGAGLVFLAGGIITLVGLWMTKPPPTDTPASSSDDPLQAVPLPAAYLPILSVLGAGLTLFGWVGLAMGAHIPTAVDFDPVRVVVIGLLAAFGAMTTSALYSLFVARTVDPLMLGRSLIAGLVIVSAGAPFLPVWSGVVAGLVIGLLFPLLLYGLNESLRLDDTLAIVPTFGVSAALSLLLLAVAADGQAGTAWNGISQPVPIRWTTQIQAQLLGLGAIGVWSAVIGGAFFLLSNLVSRPRNDEPKIKPLPGVSKPESPGEESIG